MTPEFSRVVEADTISESPRQIKIDADETERRKLAGRFGLQAIKRLSAQMTLTRRAGIIHAEGTIDAAVTQSCAVTGDPMPAKVAAPLSVRFLPDAYGVEGEEETELSAEDCDTLPIENGKIDLGELAAETLVLALDPFPRSTGADTVLLESGLIAEPGDVGPFSGLKGLKDRLGKSD